MAMTLDQYNRSVNICKDRIAHYKRQMRNARAAYIRHNSPFRKGDMVILTVVKSSDPDHPYTIKAKVDSSYLKKNGEITHTYKWITLKGEVSQYNVNLEAITIIKIEKT